MDNHFDKVRNYVLDLNHQILFEDPNDGIIVINSEKDGISNLVLGCADPILIMEQFIFEIKNGTPDVYKALLKKNRDIIHGSFVLDETGTKVIFRDTLQMENLDLNEVEASINSLSLLLSEFSQEILKFSKS